MNESINRVIVFGLRALIIGSFVLAADAVATKVLAGMSAK